MHRFSSFPQFRVWFVAGALAALAGCGESTADFESAGAPTAQASSQDAGSHSKASAGADASAGTAFANGGGNGSSTPGPGQQPGVPATDTDQGIGLKPGGAQDIAFFRMKLTQKLLPKAADLTLEGFLNEHDTPLPPAAKDRLVSLHALAAVLQPPGGKSEAVLQIGLNSAKKLADVQTSLALTVVVDRSGSMNGAKMANVKAGLHVMADSLPKGTRLALVSFSSDVSTSYPAKVLAPTDVIDVHAAIDALKADGGTNLHGGLTAGLAACKQAGNDFQIKRILFLSDGVATAGNTAHAAIVDLAKGSAAAGCSVSTVGVGNDFDLPLMTEMAQVGQGTAWFVQNADHAKAVFVQDLETMLIPVAEKLWMQFNLGAGWQVLDIPGFDWVTQDGKVTITGTKKAPATPGQPPEQLDPPAPDPVTGKVAMPTLFASKKNGLVMVRLAGPASLEASKALEFQLASVEYGYSVAKTGAVEKFTVNVQVPGLEDIPDAGLAYFASPIVRRAWLLLHTGIDLMDACKLTDAGQNDAAKAVLNQGIALLAAQQALAGKDLATVDTTDPNLADATALLTALKALIP